MGWSRIWESLQLKLLEVNYDHEKSKESEMSKILWSMAKTGLVPLRKKNINRVGIVLEDDTKSGNQTDTSNLGGLAQARRPDWLFSDVTRKKANIKSTHKTNNNKKQTFGGPMLFSLTGPPG